MVLIKKRNFKPYVLNWLIAELGLGLSIGNIFYMAEAGSGMEQNLKDNGIPDSEIYHTLAAVEDATASANNDVVCVAPGTYHETTETNWDKPMTHLFGLGGPNTRGCVEDGYTTLFYCETTTIARIVDLTGARSQFHNVAFANNYAAAGNLTSFYVNTYGVRLKNCNFMGMMASTQCDTTLASSLEIGQGTYLVAENCIIGTTEWATQGSTTNAPLLFSNTGSSGPSDGKFTNCKIQSQIGANTHPLIHVAYGQGMDRDWVFDRCEFYAFSSNHGYTCAQIITNGGSPSTHDVLFKNCAAFNCTAYRTTSNACTWSSGPTSVHNGGVADLCASS